MKAFFEPFEPHPLVRNAAMQTILGSRFPGNTDLPPRVTHKVQVDSRAFLLLKEIPPSREEGHLVLLAHGMGGCSESGYMRRIAHKLSSRGIGVFMMNHRGSGPGMGMSDRLWNGGSSDDLARVVEYVVQKYPGRGVLLVGFSLSGNVLLKYLGEGRRIPSDVRGAFAVNPPVDLRTSCRVLSSNGRVALFNRYYMKLIRNQCHALAECFPDAFQPDPRAPTIWDFDIQYTAPAGGFKDAEDYYFKCSANRFMENIRVPTTILCSKDDPFIPPEVFKGVRMSLAVNFYTPDRGGHMGYLSKQVTPLGDRRWMDHILLKWVEDLILV